MASAILLKLKPAKQAWALLAFVGAGPAVLRDPGCLQTKFKVVNAGQRFRLLEKQVTQPMPVPVGYRQMPLAYHPCWTSGSSGETWSDWSGHLCQLSQELLLWSSYPWSSTRQLLQAPGMNEKPSEKGRCVMLETLPWDNMPLANWFEHAADVDNGWAL